MQGHCAISPCGQTLYRPSAHAHCQQQSRMGELACAVSDSSPDEATRLMGPEAHMMAFTSSCKLSARRNLLSAKMSSTRQAFKQDTVRWVASTSRSDASPGGPESAPSSEIKLLIALDSIEPALELRALLEGRGMRRRADSGSSASISKMDSGSMLSLYRRTMHSIMFFQPDFSESPYLRCQSGMNQTACCDNCCSTGRQLAQAARDHCRKAG